MLVVQPEELAGIGIYNNEAAQLMFQKTCFFKGLSFAKNDRQAAITICNQYLRANITCLIVENQNELTLWSEKQDLNLQVKKPTSAIKNTIKAQNIASQTEQNLNQNEANKYSDDKPSRFTRNNKKSI